MKRILTLALLLSFVVLPTETTFRVASAQSSQKITSQSFEPLLRHFNDYQRDFASFMSSQGHNDFEFVLSSTLAHVAESADLYLDTTYRLLWLYENMTCEQDKALTAQTIKLMIPSYLQLMEAQLTDTNNGLSHTRLPGMAATAVRMRDDLREARTLLYSLQYLR